MKTQPLFILSGFLLWFSVFSSCGSSCEEGSGKTVSENRKLDSFTKLNVSGVYKIVLKQGNPSVKITADDNLLKLIEMSVSGDELSIKTQKPICNAAMMEIDISNPDFQAVESSDALDLSSDGKLTLKDFDLELSGAAKVKLDLNAANVKIKTSGAADINLTGQATENQVITSGVLNLNAFNFVVANYRVESSGITHCKINVLQQLNINISGTGGLEYKGNPSKISNEHSAFTSIKKIQ